MLRIFTIFCAVIGAGFLLGRVFPGIVGVAFTVAGFGISWMILACLGVGNDNLRLDRIAIEWSHLTEEWLCERRAYLCNVVLPS